MNHRFRYMLPVPDFADLPNSFRDDQHVILDDRKLTLCQTEVRSDPSQRLPDGPSRQLSALLAKTSKAK